MKLILKCSKYLIVIFILYLSLAPNPILWTGMLRFFPTITLLLLFFGGMLCFGKGQTAQMGKLVAFFSIYIMLCAIFQPSFSGGRFMTLIRSTYWCWIYYISYAIFSYRAIIPKRIDNAIFLITLLFTLSFYFSQTLNIADYELVGDNAVFYSILLIPWIACVSNTNKRWIMLTIVVLCAIIALKRSGIIIISISIILLYINDFIYQRSLQVKTIISAILVATTLF